MHAHALSHDATHPDRRDLAPRERVTALVLVVVMAAGSLVLWIGIPAAWLWVWSQLTAHNLPVTMAAWAWGLHRVNRVYLRIAHTPESPRPHTAWLRSMSGSSRRQPRGVLEICMTVSVVLALVTFVVWFFFFTAGGSQTAPVQWNP
jgi:type VI protein secretion system component VasF